MPRLELIILDYDETMVDNTVDFYEAYCGAMKHYGVKCTTYQEFLSLLVSNNLQKAIPSGVSPEEFFRLFRRLYISRHSSPQRGLREFLIEMRNLNVKTVVVSGRETSSWYIKWDLERHGLIDFIDEVLTIGDLVYLNLKEEFLFDKSQLIKYTRKKHSANSTVCIGDYVTDYYSCVNAGGVFIGLNKYTERNEELRKAGVNLLARDFYEILVLLSELGLLH